MKATDRYLVKTRMPICFQNVPEESSGRMSGNDRQIAGEKPEIINRTRIRLDRVKRQRGNPGGAGHLPCILTWQ